MSITTLNTLIRFASWAASEWDLNNFFFKLNSWKVTMFICLYGTQFSSKRDPSFSRVYTTNNILLTFPFICPTSFLWIGFHSNFNSLLVPQVSKVTNDNIIHCTFSRLFNVFEVTCSSFQQNNTTKKLIKASKSNNPYACLRLTSKFQHQATF